MADILEINFHQKDQAIIWNLTGKPFLQGAELEFAWK